ncbi:MAG TPA: cytochrome c biogenesis protein CcsA [Candidatus Angelobacter sp.]|jgi:cytochrome c-type biogenesis protein CcsB|nr:cytochrome c biogenesis protein CcsA [Candidatus Angelobacter sp.]
MRVIFIAPFFYIFFTKNLFSVELNKAPSEKDHSEKFGFLLVQDFKGRMKPINTLALELLRKIYKKDRIGHIDANIWMISLNKEGCLNYIPLEKIVWAKAPFIKNLKTRKIVKREYVSLLDLYSLNTNTLNVEFIFRKDFEKAFLKSPYQRSEMEQKILYFTERMNIVSMIFHGEYFRILPIINDTNYTWISWEKYNFRKKFKLLNSYLMSVFYAQKNNYWYLADKFLDELHFYQRIYGKKVFISDLKIRAEILYNRLNIFNRIIYFYFIFGVGLLFLAFTKIFFPFRGLYVLSIYFSWFLFTIFIYHTFGLILRWYISDHAPWSNSYESAVSISCSMFLSGFFFFRNGNIFIPSVSSLFAAVFLMIAQGNLMNPELTHLVPVLKSFWLVIHVAVIISSYGFFSTGAFLGGIVLIFLIFKGIVGDFYSKKIEKQIQELTLINEMALTLGIFFLTVGTFLGGVWANESWGNYWSWDPKETWSIISIIVYSFVLHMRLIPEITGVFYFNLASLLSISSIIMTYFGVNYYLSGMHSYAKGYPIQVTSWIYYAIFFIFIIAISAYLFSKNKVTF